ncbi:MAG: D-mannonate oxidoreductase [Thermocaproicibacter melissae]|jgi:fructuronate reductase|uniref:mannitol dehydrogenase family protein n=1 Tax=Thermocaproicibacter melissae TaxID=2966552 RepID=UPI0024B17D50|nr:mannitol dehydrogenase family protein [Thermocaproicibacter melissae]WBY63525.1 mannitol dehydrogenase family protein [Thermocaproicibacter melissae]
MKLTKASLQDKSAWESANVVLPKFDIDTMCRETEQNPIWVHFGSGNIFRGFIARLQQQLLNEGLSKSGIIAADTFDAEIINKIYKPHDNLSLYVSLEPDGNSEMEIVASVAKAVDATGADPKDMAYLTSVFENPSLQLVSFTITEKGYALANLQGEYFPIVKKDIANGPEHATHAMSIVAKLLFARYKAGAAPIAVVSMDNCSHNGEKLRSSVLAIAEAWAENGFVDSGFIRYLKDESKVTFPWSMIDKITPRPSETIEKRLTEAGIEEMAPIITEKKTFIAPFVNAEVPQYLVIEDRFPNGRPPLEKAGVFFTDRETVNNSERMKVTTCLNPLHTALAVFGCLLGYKSISAEMKDEDLKNLVLHIGYDEGMPVCVNPGIINPADFIREVIEQRLPNPFLPDTPQRIATDTSQKIPIRFGETIKSYIARDDLNVDSLTYIPLAIAGWLRYLLGVDDCGESMEVSSDPMLAELKSKLAGIEVGKPESYKGQLQAILSNEVLFATDLTKTGLNSKIETMFVEMLKGPGAVRAALKKYL